MFDWKKTCIDVSATKIGNEMRTNGRFKQYKLINFENRICVNGRPLSVRVLPYPLIVKFEPPPLPLLCWILLSYAGT